TFTAVSFSVTFLPLALDTRGDDDHSPPEAGRAQTDEEEKEKLAYRVVHVRILAVVHCIGMTDRPATDRRPMRGRGLNANKQTLRPIRRVVDRQFSAARRPDRIENLVSPAFTRLIFSTDRFCVSI